MDSILTSIKKLLGIEESYEHFDPDIIVCINSVFTVLTQIGVGPATGFSISDKNSKWIDFVSDINKIEIVKTYVHLRVKLLFDPPMNGSHMESIKQAIEEAEWRLYTIADGNATSSPEPIYPNPGGGEGYSITVDDALSDTSTNPVQNRVIYNVLSKLNLEITTLTTILKNVESVDNRVTTVDSDSDDKHYPTARAVREAIREVSRTIPTDYIDNLSLSVNDDNSATLSATRKNEDAIEGLNVSLVTPEMLNDVIGDIETALENIITKYGLGGDSV